MKKRLLILLSIGVSVLGLAVPSMIASASSVTWNNGDVFVAVGNGAYKIYDNSGVQKDTIANGTPDVTTGCSFNPAQTKLYTADYAADNIDVYDGSTPHNVIQTINTTNTGARDNESVVFASDGSFYVGHPDGNHALTHYDAAGAFLHEYFPATESRGTDWNDLAADQKTMFYTSEGKFVKRFDVSTSAQLPDFNATALSGSSAYALRLLPPGDGSGGLLVADTNSIKRLDASGNVVQTYTAPGTSLWFALNLDPDGTSFWSGDVNTGAFYRFNIATGAIEVGPIAVAGSVLGLCLKGEVTAAADQTVTATGTTISPTEGALFSGTVATVTDLDTKATASEYTASIDWGDASSSVGTISGPTGGPFTVNGSQTYKEEGTYTVKVHITDTDRTVEVATAVFGANVADAALTASPACSTTSLQSYNGPTATFTDAASPFGTLSDFSATINWGDGNITAGTVTGADGGPYAVSGSHTYGTTGNFTITTTINDVGSSTATTSCSTLEFSFAPGGGSFVIGDKNAVIGNSVTFWGAQWAKLNSLSGGKAPSSFKGFAEAPLTPACGTGWSTDPGNSTPPPQGPLPAFMGVIVTSSASKNGSTISGNTLHIVIVQTNPGYAPDPGHAGTGTVVTVVC